VELVIKSSENAFLEFVFAVVLLSLKMQLHSARGMLRIGALVQRGQWMCCSPRIILGAHRPLSTRSHSVMLSTEKAQSTKAAPRTAITVTDNAAQSASRVRRSFAEAIASKQGDVTEVSDTRLRQLLTDIASKMRRVSSGPVKIGPIRSTKASVRAADAIFHDVEHLIAEASVYLQSCNPEIFSVKDVGIIIAALQSLSSEYSAVRQLISSLQPIISHHNNSASAEDIERMLPGFINLDSKHEEVRRLIGAFNDLLEHCSGSFHVGSIAKALKAMQHKSRASDEVSRMFSLLSKKVLAGNEPLSPSHIASSVNALRYCTDKNLSISACAVIAKRIQRADNSTSLLSMSLNQVAVALKGFQFLSDDSFEVKELAALLIPVLRRHSGYFAWPDLNRVLSGICQFTADGSMIAELLAVITNRICLPLQTEIPAKDLFRCLRLSVLRNPNPEVYRPLLQKLLPYLDCCAGKIWPQDLCEAVALLADLDERDVVDSQWIHAIAARMKGVQEQMFCFHVSRMLCGLQRKTIHAEASVQLVSEMVPLVENCKVDLQNMNSVRYVIDGLVGLSNLSSDEPAVRRLLKALTPIIQAYSGPSVSAETVSTALIGLARMSSSHNEVVEIVRALLPIVSKCTEKFSAAQIGRSIAGLHSLCNDDDESISELIGAFLPKLQSCTDRFTPLDLGNCLFGLANLKTHTEIINPTTSAWKRNMLVVELARQLTHVAESTLQFVMDNKEMIGKQEDWMLRGIKSLHRQEISATGGGIQMNGVVEYSRNAWLQTTYIMQKERVRRSFELCASDSCFIVGENIRANGHILATEFLARMLCGLGTLHHELPVLHTFLRFIRPMMALSKQSFDNEEIVLAMNSLKNITDQESADKILRLITPKLRGNKTMTSYTFAKVLSNVANILDRGTAVKDFQLLMAAKINDSPALFSPKDIGTALYGIRQMRCTDKAGEELIRALTKKVISCREPFNGNTVCTSLLFLTHKNSKLDHISELIHALTCKYNAACLAPGEITSERIYMALAGLRHKNSEHQCVRELLRSLAGLIDNHFHGYFGVDELAHAVSNMGELNSVHPEVLDLLTAINRKIDPKQKAARLELIETLKRNQLHVHAKPWVNRIVINELDRKLSITDEAVLSTVNEAAKSRGQRRRENEMAMERQVMTSFGGSSMRAVEMVLNGMARMDRRHVVVNDLLTLLLPEESHRQP
jgi:hypothetical protein